MNEPILIGHDTDGSVVTLTWKAPAPLALLALEVLCEERACPGLGVRQDVADPISAWEEEQSAQRVAVTAAAHAREHSSQAEQVMADLVRDGHACVSQEQAWSLACSANGAYARLRSQELAGAGANLEPGEPADPGVDSALALILGQEPSEPRQDVDWQPATWLMAVIAQEAADAVLEGA